MALTGLMVRAVLGSVLKETVPTVSATTPRLESILAFHQSTSLSTSLPPLPGSPQNKPRCTKLFPTPRGQCVTVPDFCRIWNDGGRGRRRHDTCDNIPFNRYHVSSILQAILIISDEPQMGRQLNACLRFSASSLQTRAAVSDNPASSIIPA